jgi:hypothetical protein
MYLEQNIFKQTFVRAGRSMNILPSQILERCRQKRDLQYERCAGFIARLKIMIFSLRGQHTLGYISYR